MLKHLECGGGSPKRGLAFAQPTNAYKVGLSCANWKQGVKLQICTPPLRSGQSDKAENGYLTTVVCWEKKKMSWPETTSSVHPAYETAIKVAVSWDQDAEGKPER